MREGFVVFMIMSIHHPHISFLLMSTTKMWLRMRELHNINKFNLNEKLVQRYLDIFN